LAVLIAFGIIEWWVLRGMQQGLQRYSGAAEGHVFVGGRRLMNPAFAGLYRLQKQAFCKAHTSGKPVAAQKRK